MVHKRIMSLVDDLDGGVADETVRFTVGGEDYEIDLSWRNAATLRRTLADYVSAARRVGHTDRERRSRSGLPVQHLGDREQNRAIRAWARRHGTNIRDRGRIPDQIVHAYHHSEVTIRGPDAEGSIPQRSRRRTQSTNGTMNVRIEGAAQGVTVPAGRPRPS